eukprot:638625-Pyramimonas_sp.AAC.1
MPQNGIRTRGTSQSGCFGGAQEDNKLRRLVEQHGSKKWSLIASKLQTKASKQVVLTPFRIVCTGTI